MLLYFSTGPEGKRRSEAKEMMGDGWQVVVWVKVDTSFLLLQLLLLLL